MIARLSGRASLLLSFSGPKFARFCERSEGLVFLEVRGEGSALSET